MNNINEMQPDVKLTQFSHGGGCGCKIAPQILDEILKSNFIAPDNKKLLVGNSSKDDAAVYDIGNGQALITTTDFFMPIVDDAYDFGRIASANAISDVYAMGGKPIIAIAILGWPIAEISAAVAQRVIEGSRMICKEAGIPLAGGHSIDSKEPFFGLAVNGLISIDKIRQNNTAQLGDLLFLTKPVGVGILATAQKRGVLSPEQLTSLVNQLVTLNKVGEALSNIEGVHAMTDVTGFGLGGHLTEMTEGSGVSAELNYNKLHILEDAKRCLSENIKPGATARNWASYGHKIEIDQSLQNTDILSILPDPQTNGGLLISASPDSLGELKKIFSEYGLENFIEPIGKVVPKAEKCIYCKP
ncbi:MAG: selenide, water dikinase SelD [Ginsengibacter sp.]